MEWRHFRKWKGCSGTLRSVLRALDQMQWTIEANASSPQRPRNKLVAAANESLHAIFVEFWRRALSDASALPLAQCWSIKVEVFAKTFEADDFGFVEAGFRNSLNKQSDGIGTYTFRSDRFTCLQDKDEDDASFGRRYLE